MRHKLAVAKEEKSVERVGKFPRESVYDNVVESDEVEDEGIDNYYSDDSGSSPKVSWASDISAMFL